MPFTRPDYEDDVQVFPGGEDEACFAALSSDRGYDTRMKRVTQVTLSEARRVGQILMEREPEQFYDEEEELEKYYRVRHGERRQEVEGPGAPDGQWVRMDEEGDEDIEDQVEGDGYDVEQDNRIIPRIFMSNDGDADEDGSEGMGEEVDAAFEHQIEADPDLESRYPLLDARKLRDHCKEAWLPDGDANKDKRVLERTLSFITTPGTLDLQHLLWDEQVAGEVDWLGYSHFLDSLNFTSTEDSPLGVAVPVTFGVNHHLHIHPKEHQKPLKDKHISFPFDTHGRTFYLGEYQDHHVYVVFYPKEGGQPVPPASSSGGLADLQRIRFANFIANFLGKEPTGIDCPSPYDDGMTTWRTYL